MVEKWFSTFFLRMAFGCGCYFQLIFGRAPHCRRPLWIPCRGNSRKPRRDEAGRRHSPLRIPPPTGPPQYVPPITSGHFLQKFLSKFFLFPAVLFFFWRLRGCLGSVPTDCASSSAHDWKKHKFTSSGPGFPLSTPVALLPPCPTSQTNPSGTRGCLPSPRA